MSTQQFLRVDKVDIISDIHGCYKEFMGLVAKLGYKNMFSPDMYHPDGRTLVIAGDVTDRGYDNLSCFEFALEKCVYGPHVWIRGNHCDKLFRALKGNPVIMADGLRGTFSELKNAYTPEYLKRMGEYLDSHIPTKAVFDGGNLIVAHACPPSKKVNDHIYGPGNRERWWEDYDGHAFAVFGHYWFNDTEPRENWCCIDNSTCEERDLVAFRYPEKKTIKMEYSGHE